MPTISGTRRLKTFKFSYDFAVDAGVVGSITLRSNDGAIPVGAVIEGGWLEVATALSGGSSTGALQAEAANDLVNAAATTGAPWSSTGRKSLIPLFSGATSVKTTAERNPAFVIGVANLTQGKFDLYVQFV